MPVVQIHTADQFSRSNSNGSAPSPASSSTPRAASETPAAGEPTGRTAPATVEAFLDSVAHSRLLPKDKVVALRLQLKGATGQPLTVQELGARLVEQGQLTPWQVQKLIAGKHEGFLLGNYRLRDFVANGSIAAVFEAEHVLTHERVALKILLPHLSQKTSYLERFNREARAAQTLNHRNVLQVLDVGCEDYPSTGPLHYLVVEFSQGRTLDRVVAEEGAMSPESATEYVRQIAKGLARAHSCGIVHRNLKPVNLLLDDGDIKIMNLGVARFLDEDDADSLTIRYKEQVIGTAGFMAPEQIQNSHDVDPRSDLYSLGCVYYFLLVGRAPFAGCEGVTLMLKHLNEHPTPIHELRQGVSPQVEAICTKLLAKRPEARYQSASDLADDLNSVLLGATIAWARPRACSSSPSSSSPSSSAAAG